MQGRELGFDTRAHPDLSSQLKKLFRETFMPGVKDSLPAAHKHTPQHHSPLPTTLPTHRQAVLARKSDASEGQSDGEWNAQDEVARLEQLGIRKGVVVDVRIEWPPGSPKKKWIATAVTRVSRKKGYFQVEVDSDAPEGATKMRFVSAGQDTEWRFSSAACLAPAKGSASKKETSRGGAGDAPDQEPYVGARIEVLFDVDGETDWYGGKITRKEKKGKWLVLFDDGDEDYIVWPDPKGEVRITSSKKKRGTTKTIKDEGDTKAEKSGGMSGKGGRGSRKQRLRSGHLCRVLFEDGIKYLGVVTGQDAETAEFVIVFEDGEEHRVQLPDSDVFEATVEEALAEWHEEHGDSEPVPWFCAHRLGHALEDGEFETEVPDNWSYVLICPPKKPKRASSKRRKAAAAAAAAAADVEGSRDGAGDVDMVDAGEVGDKKKHGKKQGKAPEDGLLDDAASDAKGKEAKVTKKVANEGEGQGAVGEQAKKRSSGTQRDARKPRDRALEKQNKRDREVLSKVQQELECLLLQDVADDVLEDNDITDFVDAMSIFLPQTDNLVNRDFCLVCGSWPSKEEVLYCRDCGDCFHTYCAMDARTRKIPKEKRHMWRCPACRICEVCGGEEEWDKILCCDECDRGFHTFCLKPRLTEIPRDGWKCNDCVQCVSCGLKHSGTRKDIWRKDCTLCVSCFALWEKKNYCPICKVVWRKEDNNEKGVECDACKKWVHPACCGIDDAKYQAMQEEEEPWNCPKCCGDLEVSDEEEVTKTFALPTGHRIIEKQTQFEDFCQTRVKMLQRACEAVERVYQPCPAHDKPSASGDMHMAAADGGCQAPAHAKAETDHDTSNVMPAQGQAGVDQGGGGGEARCDASTSQELSHDDSAADGKAQPALAPVVADSKPALSDDAVHHEATGALDAGVETRGAPHGVDMHLDGHDAAARGAAGEAPVGASHTAAVVCDALEAATGRLVEGQSDVPVAGSDEGKAAAALLPAPALDSDTSGSKAEANAPQAADGSLVAHVPAAAAAAAAAANGPQDEAVKGEGGSSSQDAHTCAEAAAALPDSDASKGTAAEAAPDQIDVGDLKEEAKHLSAQDRMDKVAALARLKKDLYKIEKAIEKHRYVELVGLLDDVLKTLDDDERFGCIPKEVDLIRRHACEAMPKAARRSALVGDPLPTPLIVTKERLWARQPVHPAASAHANFLHKVLPGFADETWIGGGGSAAAMAAHNQRALLAQQDRLAAQRKKATQAPSQQVPQLLPSKMLSLVSEFYAKVKLYVQPDQPAHDILVQHLFQSGLFPGCFGAHRALI